MKSIILHLLLVIFLISCKSKEQDKTSSTRLDEVGVKQPKTSSVFSGNLTFTKADSKLIPVGDSANAFFDADNDGDLDLVIAGYTKSLPDLATVARIYINDGQGNFIHDPKSVLTGVEYGDVDVADFDNDGDLDIMLIGKQIGSVKLNIKTNSTTRLYVNNNGTFKNDSSFRLDDVYWGKVKFCNVNNDTHVDVIVAADEFSKVYINNNGKFIEDQSTIETLSSPIAAVFDMDNDKDDDLIIQGTIDDIYPKTVLYENRNGSFIIKEHDFFAPTQGILQEEDIDNDGDVDVFISGQVMLDENRADIQSYIYINDGKGNFQKTNTDIVGYNLGNALFVDIDNDQDKDMIIAGNRVFGSNYEDGEGIDIYLNNGKGNFELYQKKAFEFYSQHSINASDIDGDGDQDILVTGYDGESPSTAIYLNNLIK